MAEPAVRVVCLSDFNVETLAALLTQDAEAPSVRAEAAPFGQVIPLLLDPDAACWRPRPAATLVWTQPQGISESFAALLAGEPIAAESLLADVDRFAALLAQAAPRAGAVLVPTWTVPQQQRGLGLLDVKSESGLAGAVLRMNARLADAVRDAPNIYLLSTDRWLHAAGKPGINPKLWYMAKNAFGQPVLADTARDVKAALRALTGQMRKLVVVDLDNTLWGGLVGEVGWEQLTLGGHDPFGEAFADFQRALKALSRRGILLGIVSKNDEAAALEALRRHPEMVLRTGDFAGWRINWDDKAKNVVDLVEELNLGLQSVVFIDDQPAERARVREALPEVLVPEWPADVMAYAKTLRALTCFDPASLSREDRERTRLYATERRRETLKREVGSIEEWLQSLGTQVTAEPLGPANLPRAAQLLNKTNQMNLSTRRMTETELWAWAQEPTRRFWTITASDRFGDAGLTGLISLEADGGRGRIVDFVLSCRVMGRKIEETMLAVAIDHARSLGITEVAARYLPTEKNRPCLEFWQRSGWSVDGDAHAFRWDARQAYPAPAQVTVNRRDLHEDADVR